MKFLRHCWEVFKEIPSRRADYHHFSVTKDPQTPPKYCATRWIENVSVAEVIIENLPNLQAYVDKVQKEPDSASYTSMKKMLKDPLLKAKLCFFVTIAHELEIFLKKFQDDKPMVPFLFEAVENIIISLSRRFVKPTAMGSLSTTQKLQIPLTKENVVEAKSVDIGFAAKSALKSVGVTEKHKREFATICLDFLKAVFKKLEQRSPMKYPLVEGSACLDPLVMASESKRKSKMLEKTLEYLVEKKWITGFQADSTKIQYMRLTSNKAMIAYMKTFDQSKDRLDDHLLQCFQEGHTMPELERFVRIILCLSHGQASVERGFSVNKETIVENQKEQSLIAQRMVKDHTRALYDGDTRKFDVSKKLILCSRNSAARYREARKEEAQNQKIASSLMLEKKMKASEIKEKEDMKKKLLLQIENIDQDIHSLMK